MNVCLVALAITLGCTGAPVPSNDAPADRWLAEDKLRHFALSFAATEMGYGGARIALEPDVALPVAAGTALALGIAKEIRDARAGAGASAKDLVWDVAGIAVGVAMARQIR